MLAMEIVYSVNDVPIRLTDERWLHIVSNKPYMYAYEETILATIEQPMAVIRGYAGALVCNSSTWSKSLSPRGLQRSES